MKKVLGLLFLGLLAGNVNANNNDAEAAALANCGHWEYYNVQVCDERQVPIIKEITSCEYVEKNYSGYGEPRELFRNYEGHIECPTLNRFNLIYQSHSTKTVYETEKYNCRTEQRRVWVREGGPYCGIEP